MNPDKNNTEVVLIPTKTNQKTIVSCIYFNFLSITNLIDLADKVFLVQTSIFLLLDDSFFYLYGKLKFFNDFNNFIFFQIFSRKHHRHTRHLEVHLDRSDEGRLHRTVSHGNRSLQIAENSGWKLK